MSQIRNRQSRTLFYTAVGLMTLCVMGCDYSQQTEPLRRENQLLRERIGKIEERLLQMEKAVTAERAQASIETARQQALQIPVVQPLPSPPRSIQTQTPVRQSEYTVTEGDNLWSIARKKLGSGNRYPEILELNPGISSNRPLTVGTRLILPER